MIRVKSLSAAELVTIRGMGLDGGGVYIAEHRLVMAKHLGRPLRANEVVHHLNGVKTDNRIENLRIVGRSEHLLEHSRAAQQVRRLEAENERLKHDLEELWHGQ